MIKAYLQKISYYYPEKCLTNEDLSTLHPEWSADKISKKTGIYKRYISGEGETAVDMAEKAALKLFEDHQIDRGIIDFVILCTQSPDYFLPTSACILQDRLGLSEDCGAYDYDLGCSGYVYGLGIAKGLIESGQAKNVLLLTSETYTKYIHPQDKSCKTIFGDGASASLVSADKSDDGMNAVVLQPSYRTLGSKYHTLIVQNGASKHPSHDGMDEYAEDGSFVKNADNLFMDGKEIFEFSAIRVPDLLSKNLDINGMTLDDVDWFVFHQANQYMLNFVKMKCKLPADKFVMDLADGGNTVSSTIPIVLSKMHNNKKFSKEQNIVLSGFGVGLSIANVILKIE